MCRFRGNIAVKLHSVNHQQGDPDTLYMSLFNVIKSEFNYVFKEETFTKRKTIKLSDWATVGIHRSRAKLYDLKQYNHEPVFTEYVKKYSKLFEKVCVFAKSLHLCNKIKKSQNKIKATWNIIISETGKTTPRDSRIQLNINGTVIKNYTEIAYTFNDFFTNIRVTTTGSLNS